MPDDLTRIETLLDQHRALLVGLQGSVERLAMQHTALRSALGRQEHRLQDVQQQLTFQDERLDRIEQALVAIKDMLERGNSR